MDLEAFLDRVVPPGNFLALTYKMPGRGMAPRFFPRHDIAEAARYARWASSKGGDVWHALASYNAATLKVNDTSGKESFTGARTQANAYALKSFWFDADIKRDGDGKDPAKVFASLTDLLGWVGSFKASSGIPLPNMWVRSGYGMHLYWIVEDAIEKARWQPYAEALKAALAAGGAKGDLSVVADAARVLRPVDTFNFKIPAQPAPCYVFAEDKLCLPDYPNATFLQTLQGFLPTVGTSSGLSGPPPRRGATPIADAARINAGARPRDFNLIAGNCGQVHLSLNEGGANDGRQLWHALLTLAWFCEDGRRWAHQVGQGHAQYSQAGTDKEFDQIDAEHKRKPFGPPLCRTLDGERGGICQHCPHNGAVSSPYQLGLLTMPDELPYGYQRNAGWIEHQIKLKDGYEWRRLIEGDIVEPILEEVDKHFRLRFTYTCASYSREIAVEEVDITSETSRLKVNLGVRGLTLNFDNTRDVGRMLMAWIEKLRGVAPRQALPPFGWAKDSADQIVGFAAGGACYMTTGEVRKAVGDDELIRRYTPRGTLDGWKAAVDYVIKDQPVLQIAVASAFASPLIEFADLYGVCLSIWSMRSGTGKTSAFRLGASVWGSPRHSIFTLDDTYNSIMKSVGEARMMPAYWDEGALIDERQEQVKNLVFKLTQGRDKLRMGSDARVRLPGEWKTLLVIAANRSIRDLISNDAATDATALRILEMELVRTAMPYSFDAQRAVSKLDDNYGTAGVEYARFISSRVEQIRQLTESLASRVYQETKASSEERFYVSAVGCILAGAAAARACGLVDFDIPAMFGILCDAVIASRQERADDNTIAPIQDPSDRAAFVLNEFCNHHRRERVVTKRFKTSGPIDRNEQLIAVPLEINPKSSTPAYQIAIHEKRLRIDRRHFGEFCRYRNYQPRKIIRDATFYFLQQLGHPPGPAHAAIGAGTLYTTPKASVFEVSLEHPKLAHLLVEFPAVTGGNNVVPLRTR